MYGCSHVAKDQGNQTGLAVAQIAHLVCCTKEMLTVQVELVEPPELSAPGDRVSVQGFEDEPDEQLNPKKKIFEQVYGQQQSLKSSICQSNVCM